MSSDLVAARLAFETMRWAEAFRLYADLGAETLGIGDLERAAAAAQLVGEDEASDSMWERAHLQLLDDGELERSVRCAFWLAFGLLNRGQMAPAGGWIGKLISRSCNTGGSGLQGHRCPRTPP